MIFPPSPRWRGGSKPLYGLFTSLTVVTHSNHVHAWLLRRFTIHPHPTLSYIYPLPPIFPVEFVVSLLRLLGIEARLVYHSRLVHVRAGGGGTFVRNPTRHERVSELPARWSPTCRFDRSLRLHAASWLIETPRDSSGVGLQGCRPGSHLLTCETRWPSRLQLASYCRCPRLGRYACGLYVRGVSQLSRISSPSGQRISSSQGHVTDASSTWGFRNSPVTSSTGHRP